MSEEEKEAIAFLRRDIKFRKNNKWFENCIIEPKIAQTLLNLIDKLQKENEELKEEIEIHKETENDLEHEILRDEEEIEHKQKTIDKIIKELEEFYEKYDVISKEKIRTKIKEYEDTHYIYEEDSTIEVLKELLGE